LIGAGHDFCIRDADAHQWQANESAGTTGHASAIAITSGKDMAVQ
jgi:hypothetical protein